jgi:hypothetical protein
MFLYAWEASPPTTEPDGFPAGDSGASTAEWEDVLLPHSDHNERLELGSCRVAGSTEKSIKRQNGCCNIRAKTTMPNPHLPAETLDHVVDLLHDTRDALRNCCLVSKSWIPRTRKHLFADIRFRTVKSLQSWKETFPDHSASPARYTKILSIRCPHTVTAADAEAGGWIRGFSRVVHLGVDSHGLCARELAVTFAPFHGFSPVIKSLPRELYHSFVLANFQPHPFFSSSQGLDCDHSLLSADLRR